MHQRTLRYLMIAGFFASCLLPTLGIMGWAISHQFSWRAAALERQLSRDLGVSIHVRQVRYPRPKQLLLSGVNVTDPETQEQIAEARLIEVTKTGRGPIIVISQPTFDLAHTRQLWHWVEQRMLRHDWQVDAKVAVFAKELTLRNIKTAQTLTQVRCEFEDLTTGPRARVTFQLAGQGATSAAELRVVRNRQITPPATGLELHCPQPLPCRLFGEAFTELVGTSASFRGIVKAVDTVGGWRVAADKVELRDVQLENLLAGFPHQLAGKATIKCGQVEFEAGRLVKAVDGALQAGPGIIGRSLLESTQEEMGLAPGKRLHGQEEPTLSYQDIAFRFEVAADDASGELSLTGECPTDDDRALPPGTVIADGQGDLLHEPLEQPQPAVRLVSALSPRSEILVPAAVEARSLLSVLPMPAVVPPQQQRRPRATVRLVTGDDRD